MRGGAIFGMPPGGGPCRILIDWVTLFSNLGFRYRRFCTWRPPLAAVSDSYLSAALLSCFQLYKLFLHFPFFPGSCGCARSTRRRRYARLRRRPLLGVLLLAPSALRSAAVASIAAVASTSRGERDCRRRKA